MKLRFTVGNLIDAKRETGIDLFALADKPDEFLVMVEGRTHELLALVWGIWKDSTTTYEDWLYSLDAERLEEVREAIWEACADFFPRSWIGALVRKNGTIQQARTMVFDMAASDSPSSSPASSASTLDPTH